MSFTLEPEALPAVEAEEIDRELGRLLESHHFSRSLRYPALLQFLVQQVRRGNASQLKERLVGIEVFHRPPDYDTNTDPVVRVTAAEVRKRIAQYYQEPEHSGELRIDLPTGSYIPRFLPARPHLDAPSAPSRTAIQQVVAHPEELHAEGTRAASFIASDRTGNVEDGSHEIGPVETLSLSEDDPAHPAQPLAAAIHSHTASATLSRRQAYLRFAAALLIGAGLASASLTIKTWRDALPTQALHRLWAPMDVNQPPLIFVIGDHSLDDNGRSLGIAPFAKNLADTVQTQMDRRSQVPLEDLISLDRIHGFLTRDSKRYRDKGASEATLEDLRGGPVVLYAGFDNRWSVNLSQQLRFRLTPNLEHNIGIILDSKDASRKWSVDFGEPVEHLVSDYGIVARYFDPLLEQNVLLVAGIGSMGTAAASEFVTQERFCNEIYRGAPDGWKDGNFEIVLHTPVIDGQAGPPQIIASTYW